LAGFSRRFWLMLMIAALVLVNTGGGAWASYQKKYHGNSIAPGTEVAGISLGGLDKEEARAVLEQELVLPDSISVQWESKRFSIPLDKDVASFDLDKALGQALQVGRSGEKSAGYDLNFIRWFPQEKHLFAPMEIAPSYLEQQLDGIKQAVDKEPVDAELTIENYLPDIKEEKKGVFLDRQQSQESILKHVRQGQYQQIPLIVKKTAPQVTEEDLPDFSQRLAYYETPLDLEQEDRVYNISLAKEEVSTLVLEPGEVFSFNEILGEATADKGYREVLVIENRQFVPGVGGGICQVATTIYQAALRAELEIVQRSNHSRPVSYVPLGFDATIAYNRLDLQFYNNRDFPVMMVGRINESLRFDFYGAEADPDREIEIIAEKEEVLEPRSLEKKTTSLPRGERKVVQQGEDGYRVNVYRRIYEKEEKVARELVSTDTYMPINEIVHIGIMDARRK